MGFHSSVRANPGKQITEISRTNGPVKVEVIPSPPYGIARFVGVPAPTSGDGISDAMGGPILIHNVASSGVNVSTYIDGPDGNFKIGETGTIDPGVTAPALATVQLPIEEGETIQAQMETVDGEAVVFAPWLDYLKGGVLELRRVTVASGAGWQTAIPAPTPGRKNYALGHTFAPNSARVAAADSLLNARVNDNGTLYSLGGDAVTQDPDELEPFAGGAGLAMEEGQSLEVESIEGDPILYISFLALPEDV
jgi:hypothetical protein